MDSHRKSTSQLFRGSYELLFKVFLQVLWKGRELDFVPSSNRAGGSEDNLTVMVVQFGGKHQLTAPDVVGWEIYLGQLPSLEGQRKPPRSTGKEGKFPEKSL